MIVAMQDMAEEGQIQQVIEHLVKMGFEVHRSTGARQTVLGAVGAGIDFDIRIIELMPGSAGGPYASARRTSWRGKVFVPRARSSGWRTG